MKQALIGLSILAACIAVGIIYEGVRARIREARRVKSLVEHEQAQRDRRQAELEAKYRKVTR